MPIKLTKTGLTLITLMLVSVIGIASWFIYKTIETNTRTEIYNFLTAELNSTHQSVKYWLQEHQAATKVWANTLEVRKAAMTLIAGKADKKALVSAPAQTLLRNWLRPVHVGKGYHGYFIISPDLLNLASSRDTNIGTKSLLAGQSKFFTRILAGHTAVSSPELSDVPLPDKQGIIRPKLPTMFVGAPIFDNNGTVIAVFTFRLNYSSVFTNLLQQAHIGESGETYAIDRHGRMISESRFEEQLRDIGLLAAGESSILNIRLTDPGMDLTRGGISTNAIDQQGLNRMAGSATQGQSGVDLDGYRDYRGVTVVGAWHWDTELDFGFASELDTKEAYKTLYTTRNTIIALSMLAMLMAILLALIYYIYQQRKQAEDELRQAATVFDNTDEGIIVTDAEKNIIAVNKAFTVITGYQRDEVQGKNPSFHQSGRHGKRFYQTMWNTINDKGQWRGEIWNQRKSGEIYPVWENINAVKDNQGHIINYVSVFTDISSIKESEAKLAHIAHHDALTGLPNRLMFSATLEQAFEHANRHKHKVAVLFLDLDRFKVINDTMGHANGDKLLQAVANRLTDCVRAEDTVARLGGDEFTIILYEISHEQDAANIAEKIIDVVSQPIMIDGHELITSTSIGISLYPDDATNYIDLVKAADAAMYHAKERGRKNYQFYTQELTQKTYEHLSIERGLHRALDNGELELYYQPQLNLHNGHIVGVEALVRWHHPERGLLLPDVFIPIAEESYLIDPISEWVLRTAHADLITWKQAGLPAVRMAINISPRQLSTQTNINKIHAVLEELDLDTHTFQIDLEITESVLEFAEDSIETIGQLKQHNVMLAIDDFGTGHSSLSRLKDLPIDTIKIDQSFVNNIPDDPDDQAIVSAIIAMAHSLNLTVIAEGVENREQMLFLCGRQCDEMQGFLFSDALPASEIPAILKQAAKNHCE